MLLKSLKKKDLVKKTQIENKNFDTKINFETDDLLKFSEKKIQKTNFILPLHKIIINFGT